MSNMLALQHLQRTATAWLQSEDDYISHKGEGIPYSTEYAAIIENRIFNTHALKEAIRRISEDNPNE